MEIDSVAAGGTRGRRKTWAVHLLTTWHKGFSFAEIEVEQLAF
jgi:hypothetical protein